MSQDRSTTPDVPEVIQLLRDIQSNMAIGEPEWSDIESRIEGVLRAFFTRSEIGTTLAVDAALPDCMMPDGADPCEGFKQLQTETWIWRKRAEEAEAKLAASAIQATTGPLTLDNERQVFFYEQDHYYLSNFSAFGIEWRGRMFDTSEAAYQWSKFDFKDASGHAHRDYILHARSAHDAFKYAEEHAAQRRADWDTVKVDTMRDILRAKAEQHEYVRRKLLQTGARELIENSWRDPFWGWGPNRDGKNMLGRLWMEVRAELRAVPDSDSTKGEK